MAEGKLEIAAIDSVRRRELKRFEKKLGVEFKNLELLNFALTHKSFSKESEKNIAHNERLEFLGDAVLELASSTYLYKNFTALSEGELTKTRASIVCGPMLTKLANRLGVGEMLLLGHGEAANGGRVRESNLEDAFEAIIGALYLDSGWEIAHDYVCRQLAPEFENVKTGRRVTDYKTTLQELIQKKPGSIIEYVELSESGPDHMKIFECAVEIDGKIYGKGTGKSKKLAEQIAASEALKILNP